MCDTLVVLPPYSAGQQVIFGKNSDREPNEAQAIVRYPGRHWPGGQTLACTFIRIPQAEHTHTVILSKPFQMWGAEMGVNEHGVMAGNEAIFSRVKLPRKNTGLTGMDLLRLGLERASTADACLEVITALLETYGQDACGGYQNQSFYYHNSFLIADPHKAWVLETIDREWVAREVSGADTISNGLTLEEDYTLSSKNLFLLAQAKGWISQRGQGSFRQVYSDRLYTHFSACHVRRQITTAGVQNGGVDVKSVINLLGHHQASFHPARATAGEVCMHATSLFNPSQTTGSMVVGWPREGTPVVWLTGTSNPCLSVYKPFFLDSEQLLANTWNQPGPRSDLSLWWRAEKLHRYINAHYRELGPEFIAEKNLLQNKIFALKPESMTDNDPQRNQWSRDSLDLYESFINQWIEKIPDLNLPVEGSWWFRWYQSRLNKNVGL